VSAAPAQFAGGTSITPFGDNGSTLTGGTAGGGMGQTGVLTGYFGGQPATGGGSSISGNGGAGGTNVAYGVGGAGGGSCLSGSTSGAGSQGGPGLVVVITWF